MLDATRELSTPIVEMPIEALAGRRAITGFKRQQRDVRRQQAHVHERLCGVARTGGCDDLRGAVLQPWLPFDHEYSPRLKNALAREFKVSHTARRLLRFFSFFTRDARRVGRSHFYKR
jgi:hypothetical protein